MGYHIIFNPHAKNGQSRPILNKVCARLERAGKQYIVYETMYQGHAEKIAKELSEKGEEEFIVIGGDGTMHEVLNGVVDLQKARFALIPAGTGNDFCTAAGVSFDPDASMAFVLRGETKDTDYIDFSGRRCLNVGGMGMDVEVLKRCSRGVLHGKLKYLWSLIVSLFTFRGCKVRLSVNGEVYDENALFVAVCNGYRIGAGICICPGAKADDGKLEVVLSKKTGFVGVIRAFIALMKGKLLEFPSTMHFYCEEAEILPDCDRTVQLDGELYENYRVLKAKIIRGLQIYR